MFSWGKIILVFSALTSPPWAHWPIYIVLPFILGANRWEDRRRSNPRDLRQPCLLVTDNIVRQNTMASTESFSRSLPRSTTVSTTQLRLKSSTSRSKPAKSRLVTIPKLVQDFLLRNSAGTSAGTSLTSERSGVLVARHNCKLIGRSNHCSSILEQKIKDNCIAAFQ